MLALAAPLNWTAWTSATDRNSGWCATCTSRGVRMMAGSALFGGAPFIYPGTGLLEEMERLADAGLPNAAVLRMATTAPATYLGVAGLRGTVAVGQQADLVLLHGNPLDSIGHIRSIAGVFHRARLVMPKED
ncbi:MAG: amidohydrolase family protein [Flavobacteriales bacterium]|nr:amidohydrolase family protein [Flavobacteriales bacterium]